jgi:predicted nucleotidyltransferase
MLAGDQCIAEALPPWLDAQSSALVQDIVATLASHYPDLLAVVLFGSVARHDERPLTDPQPSDVDLLAIFDTDEDPVHLPRGLDITHTIGVARNRHLDAPREVQVMFTTRAMREWDTTFIANVARDGIVLWARGPLPQPLSAMERTPAHRW